MSGSAGAVHHPIFARLFDRLVRKADPQQADHRRELVAGISGRVIEIGAGNGLNFSHYPDTVTEVLAVEPEDSLRELAEKAAAQARVPVRVVAGRAGALPTEDGVFDAAVASLVLCSVADASAALAEIRRVLRPGGELRFFEHVRSTKPWFGLLQDALTPAWSRASGGCHLNRDTGEAIRAAGFDVELLERFFHAPVWFVPRHAHILGRARMPG